jgi:hypothetical protein
MFWGKEGDRTKQMSEARAAIEKKKACMLDDEAFPVLEQSSFGVLSGAVEVLVIVEAKDLNIRFDTRVVAGSIGMTVKNGDNVV